MANFADTEKKYYSYKGWRQACKQAGADRFDGNKDIAQAFKGDKWLGEWEGSYGILVQTLTDQWGKPIQPIPEAPPVQPDMPFGC